MKREDIISEIQRLMAELKAADAADLFLSPHIELGLLNAATFDPGPSMWVVNRSDVFDGTLELFSQHPDGGISRRARDKLAARRNPSTLLPEPEPSPDMKASDVPDFEVEEVLGHPRVPLSAILHFTYSIKEEHRANSALSATRRVLEYPPDWLSEGITRDAFMARFTQMLVGDSSSLVRSYTSRFPLLEEAVIAQAVGAEANPIVRGRLLQHPQCPPSSLVRIAQKSIHEFEDAFVDVIVSLDSRLPTDLRRELLGRKGGGDLPHLAELFHLYQI